MLLDCQQCPIVGCEIAMTCKRQTDWQDALSQWCVSCFCKSFLNADSHDRPPFVQV